MVIHSIKVSTQWVHWMACKQGIFAGVSVKQNRSLYI